MYNAHRTVHTRSRLQVRSLVGISGVDSYSVDTLHCVAVPHTVSARLVHADTCIHIMSDGQGGKIATQNKTQNTSTPADRVFATAVTRATTVAARVR